MGDNESSNEGIFNDHPGQLGDRRSRCSHHQSFHTDMVHQAQTGVMLETRAFYLAEQ
jgi:hypothetical protein